MIKNYPGADGGGASTASVRSQNTFSIANAVFNPITISQGNEDYRDAQIENLQRQYEEIKRQLADLKRQKHAHAYAPVEIGADSQI